MTDHKEARCILPSVMQDPLYSTRVLQTTWMGFDSSCWRRLRCHQETTWHLHRTNVRAETATSNTDTFYRSLYTARLRCTGFHLVTGCRLHTAHSITRLAMSCLWNTRTHQEMR